jgi:hypothetical protein
MAVIDDLVASGLSLPQAQAVITEDLTGDARDALVAAGFTISQAEAMHAYDADKTAANLDVIAQQGIWVGTQLPAIDAALDVTP